MKSRTPRKPTPAKLLEQHTNNVETELGRAREVLETTLSRANCQHDGEGFQVSTFIVPRAKPNAPIEHRATAAFWRIDWCQHCGALRTWTGPADSDASGWRRPGGP